MEEVLGEWDALLRSDDVRDLMEMEIHLGECQGVLLSRLAGMQADLDTVVGLSRGMVSAAAGLDEEVKAATEVVTRTMVKIRVVEAKLRNLRTNVLGKKGVRGSVKTLGDSGRV
uniref:Uncharacterized protein n=1 Tax=Compsopogon caeruleus TaxID=31354 RepID=A0A7S1TCD3_9RHOD|mmetsp:Transcript_17289/g.35909  ORF Transcript_17289/g.35909 Transcript_17289/m.35909 type:complete len:114 (+) Transcript_17289:35-376(+)